MHFYPFSQCEIDINKYKKVSRIKKGGFGIVYSILDEETSNIYAAKVIDCDNNEEQCKKLINREIGIMMYANHPTIINFIGYSLHDFQGESNITIIMEFAPNGSLAEILKKIQFCDGPKEYCNTTRQIILTGISRGMKYLHDRNIIHRDLKTGNILLNQNFYPLITDFGLSKFYEQNHSKSQSQMMGTLSYMAPEVITNSKYDIKADVYSFGIVMFEVVTDESPYPDFENGKITDFYFRNKVVNENYRPTIPESVKEPIRHLIEQCWAADPNDRPTFSEIFKKLSTVDGGYLLDDVDIDEFELYLDDINVITDPIDNLNFKIEEIEEQNKKLSEENKKMKQNNQQLESVNEDLRRQIENMKNEREKIGLSLNSKMLMKEIECNILKIVSNRSQFQFLLFENPKTKEKFTAKIFLENFDMKNKQEVIEVVCKIHHPSILEIISFKEENIFNENHPTIISNYIENNSLNELKINSSCPVFFILLGVALGMEYLHSLNIIHSNLKPSNILLDEFHFPRISDFALFYFTKKKEFAFDNSIFYTAPEILEGKEFDFKVDVYSYSMIAYKLLTDKNPFDGIPTINELTNIQKGKRPDLSTIGNKEIKNFFQICWSKNPRNRPTFTQIIKFLCLEDVLSFFNVDKSTISKFIDKFPEKQKEFVTNLVPISKPTQIQNIQSEKLFKIVLLGKTCVGKTTILKTYLDHSIPTRMDGTIGAEFKNIHLETKSGEVTLQIWDTNGGERSLSLIPMYSKGSHAVIFFTDVSEPNEYKELDDFLNKVPNYQKDHLRYLVPTKEEYGWKNTVEEIQSFADDNQMTLCRISLYDWESIHSMFLKIANDLMEKLPLGIGNTDDQISDIDQQKPKSNDDCIIF